MIGTVLERSWGAFKFNVYFFSGVILHVIAAILIYLIFGYNYHMNTYYINLALFMAFAYEQPDMEVLLFFVLPIKIKWLAWFDGAGNECICVLCTGNRCTGFNVKLHCVYADYQKVKDEEPDTA